MENKFILKFLMLLCIILAACAPVTRVNYYDKTPRRVNQGKIDVFSSPVSVPYLFKEIGLITVDDEGWGRSESELLDKAINQARNMGATGIIILGQDKQLDGYVPVGGIPVAINRRIVRASAIVKTGNKIIEKKITPPTVENKKSIADELLKLNDLKEKGIITSEEFEKAKNKLINEQ